MADHKKEMKITPNPFAICRAQGKRLGQSDEEVEKCILAMKRDLGVKSDEVVISAFIQFAGHFIPAADSKVVQAFKELFRTVCDTCGELHEQT